MVVAPHRFSEDATMMAYRLQYDHWGKFLPYLDHRFLMHRTVLLPSPRDHERLKRPRRLLESVRMDTLGKL